MKNFNILLALKLDEQGRLIQVYSPTYGLLYHSVNVTNTALIDDILNQVKNRLRVYLEQRYSRGYLIESDKAHNIEPLSQKNPEQKWLLVTVKANADPRYMEKIARGFGIGIFVLSEVMSECSFLLAAQTVPQLQDNFAVNILGSICTLIVKAFVYYYSGAINSFAYLGRNVDNFFVQNCCQKKHSTYLPINQDNESDARFITVEKRKETSLYWVACIMLIIPAIGMTAAQGLTGYQSTISLGNEAMNKESEFINSDMVFWFAVSSTITGVITALMQNIGFSLQAAPTFTKLMNKGLQKCGFFGDSSREEHITQLLVDANNVDTANLNESTISKHS